MSVSAVVGMLVLPAVVFSLAYFPVVTRLSMGLLSPYAKADVKTRLFAATIDGLLIATTGFFYRSSESVLYLVGGAAYLLLRDAVRGQSLGKLYPVTDDFSRPRGRISRRPLGLLGSHRSARRARRRARHAR